MPEVRRPGRAGAPAPQHRVLRARLPGLLPASRAGDRPAVAHVHARGAGPGRGVRREGLPRAVGRAARRGLPDHRPLHRPRDLRVLAGLQGAVRGVRGRARARAPHRGRRGRGGRGDPRGAGRHAAADVLRLRALEALHHEPRRDGGRVPGGRHGPQPRRRGRDPLRLHAALGRVGAVPADAGARGHASAARAPGEAALPDERARDGRLRVPARHRLHRGGMPVLAGRNVDRPQGAAQSPRGHVAGLEGDVPPGLPRQGARALPGAARPSPSPSASGAARPRPARSAPSASSASR